MAYSTAAFGLLIYIDKDHNWLVILSAIILRFLQGTGCGMISTAAYSFAGQAYPDTVEKVIALFECMLGLGCGMGPLIGSLLYEVAGYSTTFYIFGAAMVPASLLVLCFKKKNKEVPPDQLNNLSNDTSNNIMCMRKLIRHFPC